MTGANSISGGRLKTFLCCSMVVALFCLLAPNPAEAHGSHEKMSPFQHAQHLQQHGHLHCDLNNHFHPTVPCPHLNWDSKSNARTLKIGMPCHNNTDGPLPSFSNLEKNPTLETSIYASRLSLDQTPFFFASLAYSSPDLFLSCKPPQSF